VAMGFVIVGGNIFGMLAPIVTGYVIAATGGYSWAFVIAGALLVLGAASILGLTRQPIGMGWGKTMVSRSVSA
jgi:dipeptide/tripeptide permease